MWKEGAKYSFYALKDWISKPRTLDMPDTNKKFLDPTDALKQALGAVLMQKDDKGRWSQSSLKAVA